MTASCLPCQWAVKCNFVETTDSNGLKVTVFTILVFAMTYNLIRCRMDFDFLDHFNIQTLRPCEPCQIPHYRPRVGGVCVGGGGGGVVAVCVCVCGGGGLRCVCVCVCGGGGGGGGGGVGR